VTVTPFREPPSGTKPVLSRPNPDWSDKELQAWAEAFVDAVLDGEREP